MDQTRNVWIRREMCGSDEECVDQTRNVWIRLETCGSDEECVDQTRNVWIRREMCESNEECVDQTRNVWIRREMCVSDEKYERHMYTFRPRCLSQKLSLFSINFLTGECTENFQLNLITAYIAVVQIYVY